MKKKRLTRHSQILMGVLLIVLAILISMFVVCRQAMHPYTQAKSDAIRLAKQKTPLKQVTYFDVATTDSTTYGMIGFDTTGKKIGVLIPEKSGNLTVVNLSDNQSKLNEMQAKLTLFDGKVAWLSKDARLYDFKTGKQLNQDATS